MSTRARVAYGIATVLWMGLIFYLSSIPDLKSSLPSFVDFILRKCAHFLEYAVLYALLWKTFTGYREQNKAAVIVAILYALSDELHQGYVHGRVPSIVDAGIDAAGVMFSYWIVQKIPPTR